MSANEETHCQLKPNVDYSFWQKTKTKTKEPPLYHKGKPENNSDGNGKMHNWENRQKSHIQIIMDANILQHVRGSNPWKQYKRWGQRSLRNCRFSENSLQLIKRVLNRKVLILAQMNGLRQNVTQERGCGEPERITHRRNGNQTRTETVPLVMRDTKFWVSLS